MCGGSLDDRSLLSDPTLSCCLEGILIGVARHVCISSTVQTCWLAAYPTCEASPELCAMESSHQSLVHSLPATLETSLSPISGGLMYLESLS